MKHSKPHRLRDYAIKSLTLTFGLVRFMQPAFASDASLEVTSSPTGAEVIIDDVSTNSRSRT